MSYEVQLANTTPLDVMLCITGTRRNIEAISAWETMERYIPNCSSRFILAAVQYGAPSPSSTGYHQRCRLETLIFCQTTTCKHFRLADVPIHDLHRFRQLIRPMTSSWSSLSVIEAGLAHKGNSIPPPPLLHPVWRLGRVSAVNYLLALPTYQVNALHALSSHCHEVSGCLSLPNSFPNENEAQLNQTWHQPCRTSTSSPPPFHGHFSSSVYAYTFSPKPSFDHHPRYVPSQTPSSYPHPTNPPSTISGPLHPPPPPSRNISPPHTMTSNPYRTSPSPQPHLSKFAPSNQPTT